MDMIVQWEAHRLKSLALIIILPYLTGDLIQSTFNEIGKILFARLEDELYNKLTNQKSSSSYSPNRFSSHSNNERELLRGSTNANAVNIRIHDKLSQRYEAMKREDWLLDFDLVEIFLQKVGDLMGKLGV